MKPLIDIEFDPQNIVLKATARTTARVMDEIEEQIHKECICAIQHEFGNEHVTEFLINKRELTRLLKSNKPMKPKNFWDSLDHSVSCPACLMGVLPKQRFCDNCGQRLDWEVERDDR